MSVDIELYIYIDEDGNPVGHPIFGDNLRAAFPGINVNNLPSNLARFRRVACPEVGLYQVLVSTEPTYQLIDGMYSDVWTLRDMTDAEKSAKQQAVRDDWAAMPSAANFTTWILDDATCTMVPPVPYPDNLSTIAWNGATNSWESRSARPDDGKEYRWNYLTWSWVEVV